MMIMMTAGPTRVADPASTAGHRYVPAALAESGGRARLRPHIQIGGLRVHWEQRFYPLLPAESVHGAVSVPALGIQSAFDWHGQTGDGGKHPFLLASASSL